MVLFFLVFISLIFFNKFNIVFMSSFKLDINQLNNLKDDINTILNLLKKINEINTKKNKTIIKST
jgi:Asp-tRNA(Asn)/Glu-tRNA(Gln) amidotransferase C subunit